MRAAEDHDIKFKFHFTSMAPRSTNGNGSND